MNGNGLFSLPIQYGFAGLSVILLAVVIWLIKQLLQVLCEHKDVIKESTKAIVEVKHALTMLNGKTSDELGILREIHDKLLSKRVIPED